MHSGRESNNFSRLFRPDVLCVTCLNFAVSFNFFLRPILSYDLRFGHRIHGCSPANSCNLAVLADGARAKLCCSAGFAAQRWECLGKRVLVSGGCDVVLKKYRKKMLRMGCCLVQAGERLL